jgi:hypothetical protein
MKHISEDELFQKILEYSKKYNPDEDYDFQKREDISPYFLKEYDVTNKDLQKILFDFENYTFKPGEYDDNGGELIGFNTLNNLSLLGFLAGGDWEYPLYFMVYWDGNSLRCYVPENGNIYNKLTKTAYGSEDETEETLTDEQMKEAEELAEKITDSEDELPQYDWNLIKKDIIENVINKLN